MTVDLISTKYITIVLNHHLFYSSLTQMWLPFIIADTGQDLEGHRKQKLRKLHVCMSIGKLFFLGKVYCSHMFYVYILL